VITPDDRMKKDFWLEQQEWGRQCQRLENMRSPAALECRDKSSLSSKRHTCLELTLFWDITITAPGCFMGFLRSSSPLRLA
jgi:hypothetical protein